MYRNKALFEIRSIVVLRNWLEKKGENVSSFTTGADSTTAYICVEMSASVVQYKTFSPSFYNQLHETTFSLIYTMNPFD